ncbi:MAG: hypothetical protein AAGA60_01050 [Cyanobacteria bacterium P01_E01_bin.42]
MAQASSVAERSICRQDGEYVVFAKHSIMGGSLGQEGSLADRSNFQRVHEHIFFCDTGRITENVGFGPRNGGPVDEGVLFSYSQEAILSGRESNGGRVDNFVPVDDEKYSSDIIRGILGEISNSSANSCNVVPEGQYSQYNIITNNCQDFAATVRRVYWQHMFSGTWIAEGYQCPFGAYHTEVISIQLNGSSLIATKLDSGGDRCVPTGSRTFTGLISNNISKGDSFSITVVVGSPNAPASGTALGQLTIVDANTLYLGSSTRDGITLRRDEGR